MTAFETATLKLAPVITAPDGAKVQILPRLAGGSFARFSLTPGQVSQAVRHLSVEEIWFVVSGAGEMWRRQGEHEEIVALAPGVALTIPVGVAFQFRAAATSGVAAVAVTMPPWPLDRDEAIPTANHWPRTPGP